jgi:hypothetical protein
MRFVKPFVQKLSSRVHLARSVAMADLCAWCGEPAVTRVITRPGRQHRQTAPVCEEHAAGFESRGAMTIRLEIDNRMRRELERSQWAGRSWGMPTKPQEDR